MSHFSSGVSVSSGVGNRAALILARFVIYIVLDIFWSAVFDTDLPHWSTAARPAGPRKHTPADMYGVSLLAGALVGWGMTFVAPTRLLIATPVPAIVLAPVLAAAGGAAIAWAVRDFGYRPNIARVASSLMVFAFGLVVSRGFFVID